MERKKPTLAPVMYTIMSGIGISLFAIPVLLLRIFDYTIIATFTQFAVPFFRLIGWSMFGYGMFIALLYLIAYWRTNRWLVLIPLVLLWSVFAALRFLPFDAWSLQLDFSRKHEARMEIVANIAERFAQEKRVDELVELPFGRGYLSSGGGEIIVMKEGRDRLSVMFYIWRGILDTSSGLFVYTEDDALPSTYIGYDVYEKRLRESWYFVIWR